MNIQKYLELEQHRADYYEQKQAEHDEMAPYLALMFVLMFVLGLAACIIWAVVETVQAVR